MSEKHRVSELVMPTTTDRFWEDLWRSRAELESLGAWYGLDGPTLSTMRFAHRTPILQSKERVSYQAVIVCCMQLLTHVLSMEYSKAQALDCMRHLERIK